MTARTVQVGAVDLMCSRIGPVYLAGDITDRYPLGIGKPAYQDFTAGTVGSGPMDLVIACIGPITQKAAQEAGFSDTVVAEEYTSEGIVMLLHNGI